MSALKTPLPWAQSDSNPHLLWRDNQGIIDFNAPVAKFKNAEDAGFVVAVLDAHEELVTALRTIRNKLHARNRPDEPGNRMRIECRTIADAALALLTERTRSKGDAK